ncbi:MAG: hypothetical protein R3F19_05335 [Verrucomicrobiales bacterium]
MWLSSLETDKLEQFHIGVLIEQAKSFGERSEVVPRVAKARFDTYEFRIPALAELEREQMFSNIYSRLEDEFGEEKRENCEKERGLLDIYGLFGIGEKPPE